MWRDKRGRKKGRRRFHMNHEGQQIWFCRLFFSFFRRRCVNNRVCCCCFLATQHVIPIVSNHKRMTGRRHQIDQARKENSRLGWNSICADGKTVLGVVFVYRMARYWKRGTKEKLLAKCETPKQDETAKRIRQ